MTGSLDQEIDAYVAATSTSQKLQQESEKYLPGGSSRATAYYNPYPFFVSHAEGNYIYDVDGNRYLDFNKLPKVSAIAIPPRHKCG